MSEIIESHDAAMRDSGAERGDQDATDAPREGTLAWLLEQERTVVQGLELPVVHRLKEGDTLAEMDGTHCRVVRAEGGRCRARPTRQFGVCLAHAGGGGWRDSDEARAMGARANQKKLVLRARREVLGIGARRTADPRQIARVRALDRAEAVADALVDAPLDDASLGTLERQRAVISMLDATFPLAQAQVEISLPVDGSEVQSMGWQDMQQLASRLLEDEGYQQVPEVVET